MKISELSLLLRLLDNLLSPFMFILGGFKFPLQQSHPWHMAKMDKNLINKNNSIMISKLDELAKFGHTSPFGLYHMPIFGGLTKYVVVEADSFDIHWHVGWKDTNRCQVNRLKIYENRLKLLLGKDAYNAFALNDSGDFLTFKVIGEGKIGDRKFKGIRLF